MKSVIMPVIFRRYLDAAQWHRLTSMSVVLAVEPYRMLPLVSHSGYANRMDGRQTITLCLPLHGANVM